MTYEWTEDYSRLQFEVPLPQVLSITIDQPDRLNAVDAIGHSELTRVWRHVDDQAEIHAVLVRGGGEAFSAGGDFSLVEEIISDPEVRMRVWKETRDLVYNLINCSKPVVSAVQGPAVGAGLAVALLADISVAGREAHLVDGHTRLGVPAGDHAVMVWPLLVGMAKAKYHLLLNQPLSGEEAERVGLVSLCVDDDQVEDRALDIAERLAQASQPALRWTKYALNNWLRAAGPLYDTSTALEFLAFTHPDAAEGLDSLREKRPPDFPSDAPE